MIKLTSYTSKPNKAQNILQLSSSYHKIWMFISILTNTSAHTYVYLRICILHDSLKYNNSTCMFVFLYQTQFFLLFSPMPLYSTLLSELHNGKAYNLTLHHMLTDQMSSCTLFLETSVPVHFCMLPSSSIINRRSNLLHSIILQ